MIESAEEAFENMKDFDFKGFVFFNLVGEYGLGNEGKSMENELMHACSKQNAVYLKEDSFLKI